MTEGIRCVTCERVYFIAPTSTETQCTKCAHIDEPCVYASEPRGAFGLAGGWCTTHNQGWHWCVDQLTPSKTVG